jgi:uncharacterized membrane protein
MQSRQQEPTEMAKYKTMTFAVVHTGVAFGVVWAMTGSWMIGGAVALIEPACNTVAYFVHELAWERRRRRRGAASVSA